MKNDKTCRGQWLRHILFIGLGFIVCIMFIVGTQLFYRWKLVSGLETTYLREGTYQMVNISSDKCSHFPYDIVNGFYTEPVQGYVYRDGRDSIYEIPEVLQNIQESGNTDVNVYLELNPLFHNDESLMQLITQQIQNTYYIYLRPLSEAEWISASNQGLTQYYIDAYQSISEQLTTLPNVNVFYPGGHDWIVKNPSYFDEKNQVSADGMMQIYSEVEFNMSGLMDTKITQETINTAIAIPNLAQKEYVNAQGVDVFYLGDSMYAKDKDTSGITSITSELLHMNEYNFAIMGTSFSGEGGICFNGIADLLIANQSDLIEQMGVPDELKEVIALSQQVTPEIFVLRYGFNDYSAQVSLEEAGAFYKTVTSGIEKLKSAFPDACIVISTPTISSVQLGLEIELKEYVDAIIKIAEQEEVYCLNNYEVGIFTEGDPNTTLIDGVHYNVKGRFYQAQRLASYITSIYNESK